LCVRQELTQLLALLFVQRARLVITALRIRLHHRYAQLAGTVKLVLEFALYAQRGITVLLAPEHRTNVRLEHIVLNKLQSAQSARLVPIVQLPL